MRSVFAASMTLALEYLGLHEEFDAVYGSSAGALIGAYFVAGQAALTPAIYYEDLCTRAFVNPARLLVGKPIMSLDFLFEVMERRKPLDWQAILASDIAFHPLATSLEHDRLLDLSDFADEAELRAALRASAVLPVIAGPPAEYRGGRFLDAGLYESFPFQKAIEDGCSHVLVLRTRPPQSRPSHISPLQRILVERVLKVDPKIVELADGRPDRYAAEDKALASAVEVDGRDGPRVFAMGPRGDDVNLDRLTTKREAVKAAARAGIATVFRALGHPDPPIFEVMRPFPPLEQIQPTSSQVRG